ncbi:MAG: hypothetical protein WCI02_00555 [Planctomycetota bacterium]|jgi:hypothetical protein
MNPLLGIPVTFCNELFLAQDDVRVYYQWMRMDQLDQWHHWFLLICCVLGIASWVVYWYRKDWEELPKSIGYALLILRLTALIGILIFFFDLQKRSERRDVRSSRVAVLVDTSLSMTMPVDDSKAAPSAPAEGDSGAAIRFSAAASSAGLSRIAAVQNHLSQSGLIEKLQQQHDTTVYRFDSGSRPATVASFVKQKSAADVEAEPVARDALLRSLRWTAWTGTAMAFFSVALLIGSLIFRALGNAQGLLSYLILAGVVGSISGFVVAATAVLRADTFPWTALWSNGSIDAAPIDKPINDPLELPKKPSEIPWETLLAANGTESRLGDAIHSILEQENGSTLAGIVVLTDGRSNAGLDPINVVNDAATQEVKLHTVGLGTNKNPINVRLLDVEAPKRVFPGDRFRITALVQASGMRGVTVPIQLKRRPGGQSNVGPTVEEERSILLGEEDEINSVVFEVEPKDVGQWIYEVRVLSPGQDSNPTDNISESEVRVVEPNSTILIIAGGPTREYQFVRNLLYREPTVQSHVYLQSGSPGVSQEAKRLLTEFPKTRAEMSQYDAVIAFDADWMALSAEQINVLEQWISEQSGGLILVAGPVSTPKWAGNQGNGNRIAEVIRGLSPVVMNSRGARLVSIGRFESETAWPITFSSDAWSSEFIQIGKTLEESQKAWKDFQGVYSFFACYEPKPAATVIGTFSDPTTVVNGAYPIYLATQFYGSGRVAFQGGGEFWRLREVGETFFDTYYTKLIRWAGQGRLMRDSDRGILLVDKEQAVVGDQVMVRAVLRDAQFQPIVATEANAKLIEPGGRSSPLRLQPLPDPTQAGVFIGQFVTKKTGTYEVQLPVGSLADQVILTQQVVVRVPALEIQRPQRNDVLLNELAVRTGGKYWIGLDSLQAPGETSNGLSLPASIKPRDQVNFLPNAPDREFQQRLLTLLMALIAGALALEWLTRRLSRLA